MGTITSTSNHVGRGPGGCVLNGRGPGGCVSSGRGPVRATVRPKALQESSSTNGNIKVTQSHHRSLSSSPVNSAYQLSAKSHSLGDIQKRPLSPGGDGRRSLRDLVPVPIDTSRLRPIQQQTRRACVSITMGGAVTLVYARDNSRQEMLCITGDGMEVRTYMYMYRSYVQNVHHTCKLIIPF